uniref:DUF1461 domain-containing protein n=1 Tax=uncultured Thiotrichaceae bacterium TaxID=298394 RepID=A0A6S6S6J3_9GAMM|nr:MAG: Unknown protein [uncultured Thiotrichaceae bacterium]
MLKLAHIATALIVNIVITSCLFFLLAVTPSVFMESTPPLASEIRSYLFDLKKPLLIGSPQLNSKEERHLLDVKRILQNVSWITLLATTLAIFGLLLCWRKKGVIIKYIGRSGLIGLTFTMTYLSVSGFRNNFIWLHSLLFPPDSWWFNEESTLIRLFPLEFFQEFTVNYVILLALVFSIFWWINHNSPSDQPAYKGNQQSNSQPRSENH